MPACPLSPSAMFAVFVCVPCSNREYIYISYISVYLYVMYLYLYLYHVSISISRPMLVWAIQPRIANISISHIALYISISCIYIYISSNARVGDPASNREYIYISYSSIYLYIIYAYMLVWVTPASHPLPLSPVCLSVNRLCLYIYLYTYQTYNHGGGPPPHPPTPPSILNSNKQNLIYLTFDI